VVADCHFAKYAWGRTTGGDDYDLDHADRLVRSAGLGLLEGLGEAFEEALDRAKDRKGPGTTDTDLDAHIQHYCDASNHDPHADSRFSALRKSDIQKSSNLPNSKLHALTHMAKNRENFIAITDEFLESPDGQEDTTRNCNLRKSQENLKITHAKMIRDLQQMQELAKETNNLPEDADHNNNSPSQNTDNRNSIMIQEFKEDILTHHRKKRGSHAGQTFLSNHRLPKLRTCYQDSPQLPKQTSCLVHLFLQTRKEQEPNRSSSKGFHWKNLQTPRLTSNASNSNSW
jgi:hypothetical protein